MRRIYTCFLYLCIPWMVCRLILKSFKCPAYRQRLSERFSLGVQVKTPVDLFVHAVSLGEVVAATPLVELALSRSWRVLITTMTPTGLEQVKRRFGHRVVHQYVPYDLPWCLRRFYNRYHPRLAVIMETELWPNLIEGAHQKKIPLFLMNARISDKAYQQYQKVSWMFKPVLGHFTAILAQSEGDAARFIALGAPVDKVQSVGNMKCDAVVPTSFNLQCAKLKDKWGAYRPVLIAASTHHDEESLWLSRFHTLNRGMPGVVLLIAPRHPERFQTVYQQSIACGLKTGLRGFPTTIDANTEVLVIDSLGELMAFYALSDFAFVGGSLVPVGGHNILEPMAVGIPVCCGPHMQNSKAICEEMCAKGALVVRDNVDLLVGELIHLFQHKSQREQQIANASAVLKLHQGAVERCMNVLTNPPDFDAL